MSNKGIRQKKKHDSWIVKGEKGKKYNSMKYVP